jgi:DNA ligase-1
MSAGQHFLTSMGIDFTQPQFQGLQVAADWIRDLESSDSRLHKERVIEKALMASKLGSANAQCFLFNCFLAYNPFYTYNIKQVPETQGLVDRPNPWPQFWALCEALRTRSATGNHMRDMVDDCSKNFNSEEWNMLCRRVLIKDLRCGISEKTLNKVLGNSEWKIPVFTCQLATDSAERPNKLTGAMRLETKLDGVRVLAYINGSGLVTLYSRNGKVFENFPHIEQALTGVAKTIKAKLSAHEGVVLDGEVIGESFQSLMKQARRKTDANASDSVFYVFDYLPLPDFQRGYWNAQLDKRIAGLETIRTDLGNTAAVKIMPGIEVDMDVSEGHDIMRRFAEDAVTEGYEGIMIKALGAPYECKRSTFWMKWKPTITVDLAIVGFEPGTGRNADRLGAIICEGEDQGRQIRVNVGSGFTDAQRDEFWQSRDTLMDVVAEVQADVVSQNQDGTYSLRFPRFVRFRGFEAGEKL